RAAHLYRRKTWTKVLDIAGGMVYNSGRIKRFREGGMDYIYEKVMEYPQRHAIDFLYCGKAIYYTDHAYGPYIKDSFLVVYIESGASILHIDGKKYQIGANNLVVFYPDSRIFYKNIEGCEWRIWWMGIGGEGAYSYFDALGLSPEKPFLTVKSGREVLDCMREMNESVRSSSLDQKMLGLSLTYRLFSILAKDRPEKESTQMQEILDYIRCHYDTIDGVSELHRTFGMSRNTLWRRFREEVGCSPQEYLTGLRCRRAGELLVRTDHAVASIAYSVGYADPLYFSRIFSKEMGMPPREYRRFRREQA
ncbi:MAG: helix-turn-helix domain-containing protein, partial [Clostridia bacterium]|nr:helix-turn-helix domain-containing protein [Clostridia bacterium]